MRYINSRFTYLLTPAAIINYHFAQTTLFFQISNTKKEELKIIILVKFFFFSVKNLK